MTSPSHDTDENTDTFRCRLQKQQAGILEVPRGGCNDCFSTETHRKQLCHTGEESCHEQIQVTLRSVTFCHSHHMLRMSHSENTQNIAVTLSPSPPSSCPQGLTLRSRERHMRALGTVTAWGRQNSRLWGGGAPLTESSPHSPKDPTCHLLNTQTYRQPESISPCLCLWEGNVL